MTLRLLGAGLVITAAAVAGMLFANKPAHESPAGDNSPASGSAVISEAEKTVRPHQLEVPGLDLPLTDGSCWLLPATGKARAATVFLDPGHGGYDPGAGGGTSDGRPLHEADLTLAVAQQAAAELRSLGYDVVMSRTADTNVLDFPARYRHGQLLSAEAVQADIRARAACANEADAAVLVSLHFNSNDDPSISGTEVLYEPNRSFGDDNRRLATSLLRTVVGDLMAAGWTVPDRGTHPDHDVAGPALSGEGAAYGHLLVIGPRKAGYNDRPSEMPGVVIEALFLTRPIEADIAASKAGQRVLGAAIANGIDSFLSAGR